MRDQKTIYAELGIKTLINGLGTYTRLGGSLMPPEVVQAMAEAAKSFVSLPELEEKVGRPDRRFTGRLSGHGDRGRGVGDHDRHGRVHHARRSRGNRAAA